MLKKSLLAAMLAAASLLSTTTAFARGGQQVTMPGADGHTGHAGTGYTAVISEGDLEPASAGSYTVIVYPNSRLESFVSSITLPRNGSLFVDSGKPRVGFADIAGDGQRDLLVKTVSAGSGSYVSADALRIDNKTGRITQIAHVANLSPEADVTAALKRAYQRADRRHERADRRTDRHILPR
jgi:hypothetical protein